MIGVCDDIDDTVQDQKRLTIRNQRLTLLNQRKQERNQTLIEELREKDKQLRAKDEKIKYLSSKVLLLKEEVAAKEYGAMYKTSLINHNISLPEDINDVTSVVDGTLTRIDVNDTLSDINTVL